MNDTGEPAAKTGQRMELPPLTIRVGITGTRATKPGEAEALRDVRDEVKAILTFVQDCVAEIAASRPHDLRFLSPLAEGADRLAAEEAVGLGYILHAPLPFFRDEYAKDFGKTEIYPDSVSAFHALLAKAAGPGPSRILELDGGRGADEARSYEAVGRHVVQNCDLLIGIWNGEVTDKRGGTGDIMQYATRWGLPIWWINPRAGEPARLVTGAAQLRRPYLAPEGDEAHAALKRYLTRTLVPSGAQPPHRHGTLGLCVHHACRWLRTDTSPLDAYRADTESSGWWRAFDPLWHTYRLFMNLFGGAADDTEPAPSAHTELERYWEDKYHRADRLSGVYGNRYRSSYVLVFALAAIALVAAVTGLAVPVWEHRALAVESVALFLIGALVVANEYGSWHERWISYRLLAELCRKQRVLGLLGRALPGVEVASLAADSAAEGGHAAQPRGAWVGWYFAALQRAAPPPPERLSGRALHHAAGVARGLLAEQMGYHRDRERRHLTASRRLVRGGDLFFVFTLGLVVWRGGRLLFGEEAAGVDWLGFACALLPAASAALVGIRAYAEFELLAEESQRMLRVMRAADSAICGMELDHPLASQDLGAELTKVAMAMLQDVRGWAQLFHLKAVEAG